MFRFFAGKGGVGKTTSAAACAVAAARNGASVLAVSTDPAHSLGDALGARLSATPRLVRGLSGRLRAVELDAPRAFARWLAAHGRSLGDALEHGTWLDRRDIDALLGLSVPGVDELMALLEIIRLAENGAYDLIVIDTAPTGHTLRLLSAPDTVAGAAKVLESLQAEHRLIRERFARIDRPEARPEAADRVIELLADQAQRSGALVTDSGRSSFHWVMLPEALSLAESADALNVLEQAHVPVVEVIVNRVIGAGPPCPVCDRLRADQRRVIALASDRFGAKLALRTLPAEEREPRGISALVRLGGRLMGPYRGRSVKGAARGPERIRPTRVFSSKGCPTISPHPIDALRRAHLLFVGGKGGVGKTTVAAAMAVRIARADPTRAILLMSTDPAHSLGDVFGAALGDGPKRVPGAPRNLRVREVNAPALLAARRKDLEAALEEMSGPDGAATRVRIGDLLDLAPPGVDELLGIVSVLESRSLYDVVIVDTAPTGHAIRLLRTPDVAQDWVRVLLRLLLKYRAVITPGGVAAGLVELSKSIRKVRTMLRQRDHTRFVVVTRAAAVPRAETERLLDELDSLRIATPLVVVNALTLSPGSCGRCGKAAAGERSHLSALGRFCLRSARQCAIIHTPLAAPPPIGVGALDRWAREWRYDSDFRALK